MRSQRRFGAAARRWTNLITGGSAGEPSAALKRISIAEISRARAVGPLLIVIAKHAPSPGWAYSSSRFGAISDAKHVFVQLAAVLGANGTHPPSISCVLAGDDCVCERDDRVLERDDVTCLPVQTAEPEPSETSLAECSPVTKCLRQRGEARACR